MGCHISTRTAVQNLAAVFAVTSDSIRIDAVLVAHTGGGAHTITLRSADQASSYTVIYLQTATASVFLDNSWIADKGLYIDGGDGTVTVTVWYSQSGA